METSIGIVAAAVRLPAGKQEARALFAAESASLDSAIEARLGIERVPVCDTESASAMALAASQEALRKAELDVAQLDIIVDYTILPQEYLVPAWNMSNKLQHELGAKKAFTVGFSGGGSTNFLVALNSAVSLLATNDKLASALLVAADVTIPGNRILNPAEPVSIMGDSAGAMVLKKGMGGSLLIDADLHSDGQYHDVCYIPGGALANPDDAALYRMELDKKRFDCAPKTETLLRLFNGLLERNRVRREEVAFALYPNLSSEDQQQFAEALAFDSGQLNRDNLKSHGHLQGTDFVLNYLSMIQDGLLAKGQYFVAASHGMGFLSGVSLLQL